MAAVRNHLLSFSVLAFLNAHHQVVCADTIIPLKSQQFSLADLTGDYGDYVWLEKEGDIKLEADSPVELKILTSPVREIADEYTSVSVLRHNTGYLDIGNNVSLSITVDNVNQAIALEHTDFKGFKGSSGPQALHVSVEATGEKALDAAIAWSINESVLKQDDLPALLSFHAKAHLNNDTGLVAAIQSFNSDIAYSGSLNLFALSTNPDYQNALAIDLIESHFDFESTGNTLIHGDIQIDEFSSISLKLENPTDRFEGRFLNGNSETGQAAISLSSGATWITTGKNFINEFHWGKDGVLDITHANETVTIKTSGTITGSMGAATKEAIASTVSIEDGALLRTRIDDDDIGSGHYKLELGSVQPISPEGSRIFVEIIDERTNDLTDNLNIGLIQVDDVKGQAGKLFVEAIPHYYETALGSYKTVAEIGTDGQEGYTITSMATDLLGPSTLASNMLDFTSGVIIAHEQNADRVFSFVSDRLSQKWTLARCPSQRNGTSLKSTHMHSNTSNPIAYDGF